MDDMDEDLMRALLRLLEQSTPEAWIKLRKDLPTLLEELQYLREARE